MVTPIPNDPKTGEPVIIVDEPESGIKRITMNRGDKRNSLIHPLRGAILNALVDHDQDPAVKVSIIRGAGPSFSAGYDLAGGNEGLEYPFYTPAGEGQWPRHVTSGWMSIWDLAKPVIAQVHGYCLAGGSELATCCDLVYMAEDAQMGYPAVRFGVPDMHFHAWFLGMRKGMEMMLTGNSVSGVEAVERGWANAAVPAGELEDYTLKIARQIAELPSDLVQLNKRLVHRQMEHMGLRAGLRAGTEMCALGTHTESLKSFIAQVQDQGLKATLQERDKPHDDYRTSHEGAEESAKSGATEAESKASYGE